MSPIAAYRRPDVILYVNGLPLVFIELKNSNVRLRNAFEDNLRSYRHEIPQLFHCNAFCVLSNALETRVGSFTAGWEHFFNWFREESEKEAINRKEITEQATSLEHAADGLCEKARFKNIGFFNQAADTLLSNEEWRKQFNVYENTVTALYEACKPEIFQQHDNQRIAAIQYLRGVLDALVEQNHTRTDFAQRLQEIIDKYNSGSSSADAYYEDLVQYVGNLREESERHIRLLEGHPKVLVQDWWKDGQTQRAVKAAIGEVLDKDLPESYDAGRVQREVRQCVRIGCRVCCQWPEVGRLRWLIPAPSLCPYKSLFHLVDSSFGLRV
ncbi:type I restriction endonuclease [Marinobacter sp. HN1S83]|uniref:type I restriction endonuclease n=1 Tax=Marinobacter sp. HN1S83 TaxID=3382301 RepID=UPI00387AB4A3